jgi:hypothetical protein
MCVCVSPIWLGCFVTDAGQGEVPESDRICIPAWVGGRHVVEQPRQGGDAPEWLTFSHPPPKMLCVTFNHVNDVQTLTSHVPQQQVLFRFQYVTIPP